MPHVVKALPFHRNAQRAQHQLRYISHGEKDGPGADKRELYGFGDRYKELSKSIAAPEERAKALERLFLQDAGQLAKPTFHSHVFTLDQAAAMRFAGMDRAVAEQRLRAAVNEMFRASAFGRQVQGIYAIHWDGGYRRAAHPHIHVVYSPLRADGRPLFVGPNQLEKLKVGWNRTIDRELGLAPVRRWSLEPRLSEQGLRALRTARTVRAFMRNPARSAARFAGRAAARSITGPLRPRRTPSMGSGITVPRIVSLGIRLALGKISIPREIARAVIRMTFERGRQR